MEILNVWCLGIFDDSECEIEFRCPVASQDDRDDCGILKC